MEIPLHESQLQFIRGLASHRIPFFDEVFRFLNYFDSIHFFLFLIPILWIGFSYRWGLRVFYLLALSMLVNGLLKVWIDWPRPSTDCPEIGMFHFKSGGMPSGAAQTAMLLGALLIHTFRTRAAWVVGLCYIAVMSFSRLYLAVHYPVDILGGWIIGGSLLYLYIRFIHPIERYLSTQTQLSRFALAVIPPVVILWITNGIGVGWLMESAVGVAIGALISFHYRLYLPDAKTLGEATLRSSFAISVVVIALAACPKTHLGLCNFILSLWTSLIASPLYGRFMKEKNK